MYLVSLDDPGLTVFPTHRLLTGLDPAQHEPLGAELKRLFDVEEVPIERLDPAGEDGVGVFGYVDSHFKRGFRLRLRDTARAGRALASRPEAYRRLDAVVLETLVLKGALGMSEDDIAAKRGIAYAKSTDDALAAIDSGERRLRLPAAADAGRAGARGRGGRRDDAAEVDLLLPQGADRAGLQPAELRARRVLERSARWRRPRSKARQRRVREGAHRSRADRAAQRAARRASRRPGAVRVPARGPVRAGIHLDDRVPEGPLLRGPVAAPRSPRRFLIAPSAWHRHPLPPAGEGAPAVLASNRFAIVGPRLPGPGDDRRGDADRRLRLRSAR